MLYKTDCESSSHKNMVIQNLYNETNTFREAILNIEFFKFRCKVLSVFPENCCDTVSYFLARYLRYHCHYKNIKTISGRNKNNKSKILHDWLFVNGIEIDITANQFSSTKQAVIVEPESIWHERFRIVKIRNPSYFINQFNYEYQCCLHYDYRQILSQVKLLKSRV